MACQEPHAPGAGEDRSVIGALKDRCVALGRRCQSLADGIEARRDPHDRRGLRRAFDANIAVRSEHMIHSIRTD